MNQGLTPMLQKSSAETAGARSSRNFGGPGPRVFDFTCSATTGKAQNTPVLAAKARLKRFVSNSFATLGLTFIIRFDKLPLQFGVRLFHGFLEAIDAVDKSVRVLR